MARIRSTLFIVIREVLDEQLVKGSLDCLIRRHMPILGARIKSIGKGNSMAYHLPEVFPSDYDLFHWSSTTVESSFNEANLLPSTKTLDRVVAWNHSLSELEAVWTPLQWPRERRADTLDTPLLLVHITRYTDTTVLSINIPHIVCNQAGYASILEAWMQVVRGEQPTPFIQLDAGELDGPEGLSEEDLRKPGTYRVTSRLERLQVVLGLLPELLVQPYESRRLVFFPSMVVSNLRDGCNKTIQSLQNPQVPPLSNADVVAAILLKVGVSQITLSEYSKKSLLIPISV